MRRLYAAAILLAAFYLTLAVLAASAGAHIGVGTGIGPRLSNPLTPHIGRVYYTPGNNGPSDYQIADKALNEALRLADKPRHAAERLSKARCRALAVEYISRHGLTTPAPLRGYHGCKKYAMDSQYWATRHGRGVPAVTTPGSAASYAIHNYVTSL